MVMNTVPRKVPGPRGDKEVVKVVLVGYLAVGKTSLRKRLVSETFSANYLATLGVDFATKRLVIDDQVVELQIWDIAGQKNYYSVADRFLKNSDAALLVYDLTDTATLEHLQDRMEQIKEANGEEEPVFLVIGNKLDLQEPEMNTEEINDYFVEHGIKFDEPIQTVFTSAKTGENVEHAFKRLGKMVLNRKTLSN